MCIVVTSQPVNNEYSLCAFLHGAYWYFNSIHKAARPVFINKDMKVSLSFNFFLKDLPGQCFMMVRISLETHFPESSVLSVCSDGFGTPTLLRICLPQDRKSDLPHNYTSKLFSVTKV